MIIYGYQLWGLVGTGIALTAAHLLNCVAVVIYYSWRYKVRISQRVIYIFSILSLMGALAYSFTLLLDGWHYWVLGSMVFVISALASVMLFKRFSK